MEVYNPIIRRCFNMAFREGELGVIEGSPEHLEREAAGKDVIFIPEALQKYIGTDVLVYDIKYNTPAIRLLRAEEAMGITQVWNFAQSLAQTNPEVLDNLNPDESIRDFGQISGAPSKIFRNVEDGEASTKAIREARTESIQDQNQLDMAEKEAQISKLTSESEAVKQS